MISKCWGNSVVWLLCISIYWFLLPCGLEKYYITTLVVASVAFYEGRHSLPRDSCSLSWSGACVGARKFGTCIRVSKQGAWGASFKAVLTLRDMQVQSRHLHDPRICKSKE